MSWTCWKAPLTYLNRSSPHPWSCLLWSSSITSPLSSSSGSCYDLGLVLNPSRVTHRGRSHSWPQTLTFYTISFTFDSTVNIPWSWPGNPERGQWPSAREQDCKILSSCDGRPTNPPAPTDEFAGCPPYRSFAVHHPLPCPPYSSPPAHHYGLRWTEKRGQKCHSWCHLAFGFNVLWYTCPPCILYCTASVGFLSL